MRLRAMALALVLVGATALPAPAQTEPMTLFSSPPTATAGAGIELASIDPCPAPPQDSTGTVTARALLVRWAGRVIWDSWRPAAADGTWGWTLSLPSDLRNGRYLIVVTCETEFTFEGGGSYREPYHWYEPNHLAIGSPAGGTEPVTRLAGADRIATSIAISRDLFNAAGAEGAVVGRADSFADSLAGGPLAATVGGPLLLNGRDQLDGRTAAELDRLAGADDFFPVYLLGGTAAISSRVEDQLGDLGYEVTRIGGLNRYATAARIAREWYGDVNRIFLADGNDFHDGLVAAAASRAESASFDREVLLLTDGSRMPSETLSVIRSLPDAKRYAIGAPASKADPAANRVIGKDHVATAIQVSELFHGRPIVVSLVNRASFSDALAGGLHAALTGGPIMWTDAGALPPVVDAFLAENHRFLVAGYAYGGTAAISEAVRLRAVERINGR